MLRLKLTKCQGAMEDRELMKMLDMLFESMTGSGFLSEAEKLLEAGEEETAALEK